MNLVKIIETFDPKEMQFSTCVDAAYAHKHKGSAPCTEQHGYCVNMVMVEISYSNTYSYACKSIPFIVLEKETVYLNQRQVLQYTIVQEVFIT